MAESLRTFIAIELDKKIKDYLRQIQNEIKKSDADVRWVNPDNIHLTLKFLGDTPVEKIDKIIQIMTREVRGLNPLSFTLTSLGCFPDTSKPRVIWMGITDPENQITVLASSLAQALKQIGFKNEKLSFSPHITLGRVKSLKNAKLLSNYIKNYGLSHQECFKQTLNHIALIKSTLTQQGPHYEILRKLEAFIR